MAQDDAQIIKVDGMPLARWLELLFDSPDGALFVDYKFPTEGHLQEYVETIGGRSEEEFRRLLLRLLIPSGSLGHDELTLLALLLKKGSLPNSTRL